MNTDFPRILTLLRKERGISQKQAAAELNISQALLSHYEKGIRECGLDFVVRTAEFYNVSCDYLLGLSPERTGATLSINDLPEADVMGKENKLKGSILPTLNKKLVTNSLNITFDLLQKINNNSLTVEVSSYLMLSVYNIFRVLYGINSKNEATLFTIPQNVSQNLSLSKMIQTQAAVRAILDNNDNKKENKIDQDMVYISTETLQQEYPLFVSSLMNLIKNSENCILEKKAKPNK